MKGLSVRPRGSEVLWGNREPQKNEEQLSGVVNLTATFQPFWGRASLWRGLSHLLQLLDGVFLLVLDSLLLQGAGFQLPQSLLQARNAVLPQRGRPQQLLLLGLQRLHLPLQLQAFLLLLLWRQSGQGSRVT